MVEYETIARPYARAVFEQAQEEGQLAQWSATLKTLSCVVADRQMRRLIDNPRIGKARLVQLIFNIFDDRLSKTGANFVRILVASGRLSAVGKIFEIFEDKCLAAKGTIKLYVIAAYVLTDSQTERVAAMMAERLKSKVKISSAVDKALIGGIVIRFGDSVIDASIKGRLQRLDTIFAN